MHHKKLRRVLAVALMLVFCFGLVNCSSGNANTGNTAPAPAAQTETKTETTTETTDTKTETTEAATEASPAGEAKASGTTDVGTPRAETLIVDCTDGTYANPGQFNPYINSTGYGWGMHQLMFSNLWEIDSQNGEQFPALAAEMPKALDDTFTKFEVKLRQGIKWSDGQDFNADDLVFTVDTVLTKNVKSTGYLGTVLKSAKKIDDYTVEIETVSSYPRLSQVIGVTIWGNWNFTIIPEHIYKDVDPATFKDEKPVVLGPYTVNSYDPQGNWILYEKRADWQNTDCGILFGEPVAKYILFRYFGPEEKRVMAAINNEIDILCEISSESWEVLQASQPDAKMWLDNYPYASFDDPCGKGISFNSAKAPFNKKEFRWALALAMDAKQASLSIFNGALRASVLQVPPTGALSEIYYKPMESWLKDFAFEDGYKPFNPNYAMEIAEELKKQGIQGLPTSEQELKDLFGIGWWKYDPAKAEELLIKAGLEKKDGKWYFEGKPFTFSVNVPADFETQAMRTGLAAVDQWTKFGLDVTATKLISAEFGNAERTGNFDIGAYWPHCGILADVYPNINGWHQKHIVPIGENAPANGSRFKSQVISDYLDKLEVMQSNDPQVVPTTTEMLKEFVKEMPYMPMFGAAKFVPTVSTYWEGAPSSSNPYNGPWWWWSCFKYMLPQIKPVMK